MRGIHVSFRSLNRLAVWNSTGTVSHGWSRIDWPWFDPRSRELGCHCKRGHEKVFKGLFADLSFYHLHVSLSLQRPSLLYTIPVCQNPSGSTMSAERKQEIYDICVKYDVIICEDDPYYFLQAGPYVHQHSRISTTATESDDQFLASLVPSFLAFDRFGYVVRIDTFSKTICPGSRLGWITSNFRV